MNKNLKRVLWGVIFGVACVLLVNVLISGIGTYEVKDLSYRDLSFYYEFPLLLFLFGICFKERAEKFFKDSTDLILFYFSFILGTELVITWTINFINVGNSTPSLRYYFAFISVLVICLYCKKLNSGDKD